jgi:uncharacterized protein YjdB
MPNKPAAFVGFTSRPFNTKATYLSSSSAEGWSGDEASSPFTIVPDASAPASPGNVAMYAWRSGGHGGNSRVYATKYVNERNYKSLYMSVWVKLSAGWTAPPHGIARLFNLGIANDQRVNLSLTGQSTLTPIVLLDGAPDTRTVLQPIAGSTVSPGDWHRWEVYAVKNTPGASDGILVWWIDGTKVLDYRDVTLATAQEPDRWDHFQWQPSWGSYNDVVPGPMNMWIDHVYGAAVTSRAGAPNDTATTAPPASATVASIQITPSTVSLTTGDSVALKAVALDSSSGQLASIAITWASSDTTIARVTSAGMVTARKAGSATVTASAGSITASVPVTIADAAPAPVATVSVSLAAASVVAGAGTQATALLQDANGNSLTGRVVTWSSSDSTIARVSPTGAVTTIAAGTANIIATSEGKSGSATLTVTATPPAPVATVSVTLNAPSLITGQSTQAVATLKDANGNTLTGRVVTWSSSDSTIARVSSAGAVTSVGAGTASIVATSEGKSGSAPLTVTTPPPAPVATVTIVLNSPSLNVGQSTQAVATLKDANGNTLTGRVVTWSSSDTTLARVSTTGAVTAIAAGTANIVATSEGKSGSATLTVTTPPPVPVATVTVVLNSPSLNVGQSTQATATLKDSSGNVLTGRTITWASSNTAVATVSASGMVTAVAQGTAPITATSGGKSGSVTLTVAAPAPAPVATVTVSLALTSLKTGQTTQASATLKDANGNTLTGRTVAWASNNVAVATVSSTGLVTAVAVGSAQITATSEGQSGSASLTVSAPAPPPPPPGACTAADIASWGFDDGTWGPYQPIDGSTEQIVADATAIGGHDVRVIWHTTSGNGMSGGVTKRFDAQASQRLYVRFAYKQDPNFDNSGIKKYMRFQGPGYNGIFGTLINDHNRFNWVWDGDSQDTYTNVGTEITPDQLRGAWHWYEIMNDITVSGALHMQFWIDGVLKMDFTRAASNRGFTFGTVDVMGVFNAPSANGTDWIDEVSISRNCLGGETPGSTPPAAVASVSVTLNSNSLTAGQSTQAVATTRDAAGNLLSGRTITWSSSNTAVATVSSSGLVTAVAAGSAQITATSEGISGSATMTVTAAPPPPGGPSTNECASPQAGWIFCDDFEQDRTSQYFEYDDASGDFVRTAAGGLNGSTSMRGRWHQAGQVSAGHLSLAFGRTPDPYFKPVDAGTANYREIYWRFYVRPQVGWQGGSAWKLTRIMSFANSNWAEAMVAYVSGHFTDPQLDLDALSGTDAAGNLQTTKYNDDVNLRDLGLVKGITPLFGPNGGGQWYCVEAHTRLNDPGQSNGVHEFWVNGNLEARESGLNFLGSYSAYGINAMNVLENWDNDGAPQAQYRDFDNVVVSTQRIGC